MQKVFDMKKVWITALAAVLFVACNNEANNESATGTPAETPVEATVQADPNAKIDPVCDMAKDDTWTEYSVSGTDTTWFCSETCKTAYDGNPAKYQSKG